MSATLTIRTGDALREALDRRAEAEGKTISELVREILEEAMVQRPFGAHADHLRGSLRLRKGGQTGWPKQLRERNWRP